MLYLYLGTDRKKAREALNALAEKIGKGRERIAVSDASEVADISAAMQGGGLFGGPRIVVFDSVFASEEMRTRILESLPLLKSSDDIFFILEEKLDAATKKGVAKYAEGSEQFDAVKTAKNDNGIFGLANALKRGDKKGLWVGLVREYAAGKAPEMIHGILFWGAKQALLDSKLGTKDHERARKLVALLAELPHESRRRGFELEYALERFALSGV